MQQGKYRLVRPDDALAIRGIRVLVGGVEQVSHSPEIEAKVEGFLGYARSTGLDIRRQVVAIEAVVPELGGGGGYRICGLCLWVPSAGRTAMLFGPSQAEFPETAGGTEAAILGALEDARASGVVLVQAMMEPSDGGGKTVFAAGGLTQLATLTYMERRPPTVAPAFELPAEFALLAYEPATHGLFREAILSSYAETLDCPALSGLRDVEDVIEGHKAVGGPGTFDPLLWGVLVRQEAGTGSVRAVGCLLLGEIAARRALELVYLGLSPAVRGRGLGRLLMNRVLAVASRKQFEIATLAVDAANAPAVKLYRRCGYTSVAQRVAMIRRLV